VSTRRLIAVALVAGLAILLAGGIQLVLLATRDDDTGNGAQLSALGETATVEGARVSADAARRQGDLLVLAVTFAAPDAGAAATATVAVLAEGWALSAPDAKPVPRADDAGVDDPCPSTPLPAAGAPALRCEVAFTVGSSPRNGTYLAAFDGRHFWRVDLPAS
jgi:hypothetical protein